jgi:hypothetical protein
MLTTSNGIKMGIIGLGEREWLDTINSLPPNLIYKSATSTAEELAPGLRAAGADIIVALTHAREPNDYKLAENTTPGLIDIILGGHDHFYNHTIINKTHVLRSGTDFQQLSYLEAYRAKDPTSGLKWDINITRRDILRSTPKDPETVTLLAKLTSTFKAKVDKPVGYTAVSLDGRFNIVRTQESNLGNFVSDLMRFYYNADCSILAAGTLRGDQIYPPGVLKLKTILECMPFEDPVVVLKSTGADILAALENGVSKLPALEGRFPQVSNINFTFDLSKPGGSRVSSVSIGGKPLDLERVYNLATRGYMSRGKDAYDSLLIEELGGPAVEIVSEENGVLISTIVRQYFQSLKVLGRWQRLSPSLNRHWGGVQEQMQKGGGIRETSASSSPTDEKKYNNDTKHSRNGSLKSKSSIHHHHRREGTVTPREDGRTEIDGHIVDSDSEDEESEDEVDEDNEDLMLSTSSLNRARVFQNEHESEIIRKVTRKWLRIAGIHRAIGMVGEEDEGEFLPHWTRGIAPRLEGRIKIIGQR